MEAQDFLKILDSEFRLGEALLDAASRILNQMETDYKDCPNSLHNNSQFSRRSMVVCSVFIAIQQSNPTTMHISLTDLLECFHIDLSAACIHLNHMMQHLGSTTQLLHFISQQVHLIAIFRKYQQLFDKHVPVIFPPESDAAQDDDFRESAEVSLQESRATLFVVGWLLFIYAKSQLGNITRDLFDYSVLLLCVMWLLIEHQPGLLALLQDSAHTIPITHTFAEPIASAALTALCRITSKSDADRALLIAVRTMQINLVDPLVDAMQNSKVIFINQNNQNNQFNPSIFLSFNQTIIY